MRAILCIGTLVMATVVAPATAAAEECCGEPVADRLVDSICVVNGEVYAPCPDNGDGEIGAAAG